MLQVKHDWFLYINIKIYIYFYTVACEYDKWFFFISRMYCKCRIVYDQNSISGTKTYPKVERKG